MTIRRPIGESGGKTAFADRQSSERQSIGRRPETVHVPLGPSDRGEEEGEMGWKEENWRRGRRTEEGRKRGERRNKWTDAEKTQQRFKGERSGERERERERDEKRIVAFQTRAGWLGCDRGQMQVGRKGSCCYGGVSGEAGAALYPNLSKGYCSMQYIYEDYIFIVNIYSKCNISIN